MSEAALHPQFVEDIRSRYRALDEREEELKQQIVLAEHHLAAVREFKKQIAQQVFSSAAVTDAPLHNAVTTTHNGPTHN